MSKLIIANWKSNKTNEEAAEWVGTYNTTLKTPTANVKVVLAPAMSALAPVSWFVHHQLSPQLKEVTELAVQDLSPFPAGSYTGAVSALNVKDLGVKYALVGHSERRRYFHETHQDVANKVAQAVENTITPIVCVDEDYLKDQAVAIDRQYLEKCIVAYEPLSAIGSGNNEPIDKVREVFDRIKTVFGQVKVIYGGSVDSDNVHDYLEVADGVLVGTASLKLDTFLSVIRRA